MQNLIGNKRSCDLCFFITITVPRNKLSTLLGKKKKGDINIYIYKLLN